MHLGKKKTLGKHIPSVTQIQNQNQLFQLNEVYILLNKLRISTTLLTRPFIQC